MRSTKYKGRSTKGSSSLLRSSSFVLFTSWISRLNHCADAAAGPEFAADNSPNRPRSSHHILKYAIDHVLLENSEVAVNEQILLQRFEFQADLVGHVADL